MAKTDKPICGIVMPISKYDELHDEAHWMQVKDVITKAIEDAGCLPKAVWEGRTHDIIQSEILKNLFENDIVVCDMSTLNPNVMLEVGMRLTTKKPTILIAENGTSLPFDTGIIKTEFYDKSLQWKGVAKFIEALSAEIKNKRDAVKDGTYMPYMEAFEFETVEPPKKSVSSVEHLTDIMVNTNRTVSKLEKIMLSQSSLTAYEHIGKSDMDFIQNELPIKLHSTESKLNRTKHKNFLLNIHNKQNEVQTSRVGSWVFHKKFGEGIILEDDGDKLTINFDGNKKILMDRFVNFL